MIDQGKIENSQKRYELAKAYFLKLEHSNCVIELSDELFDKCRIHFPKSDDEMMVLRVKLSVANKGFIAITTEENENYFFYSDLVITKCEVLGTNTIILNDIENREEIDLNLVRKEFLELKKLLQGA